jgi:outer membrane protein
MSRYKLILISLLLLIVCIAQSQDKWTLKQCVDHALQNNLQVKQSEAQYQSAKISLKQSKASAYYPSVDASLSDGSSFGRSQDRQGVYIDQNSNSLNGALSAQMSLFAGMRNYHTIQQNKYNLMAASADQEKIKNDIGLNIASLFLNVLINKELVKISQTQLNLSDTLVMRTEALVSNGKEPVAKLYEIKAQRANDNYTLTNAQKNLELSLLDLTQALELEYSISFDIVEPDLSLDISEMPVPVVTFNAVVVSLPDVKAEELRLEGVKRSVKIAKASYYPNISLSASTSTSSYYMPNTANMPFVDQLTNNWRSYVGLQVNIPIFDRVETKHNISQSRVRVSQQEIQLEMARKTLFKDIQRAILNASVSQKKYKAALESVDANQEAYNAILEKFENGRATSFDLQQSKNNLEKALSDKVQSKYEFIFNTKVLSFYAGEDITEETSL